MLPAAPESRTERGREGAEGGGSYLVLLRLDAEVEVVVGVVELGAFAGLGVEGLFAGADDVGDFLDCEGREEGKREEVIRGRG